MYQPGIKEFVRGGQAVHVDPAVDAGKRMVGGLHVSLWSTNEAGEAVAKLWGEDTNDVDKALMRMARAGGVKLVIYDETLLDYLARSTDYVTFSLDKGMFCIDGKIRVRHNDECAAIARYLNCETLWPSSTEVVVERCAWGNMLYELTKDQNTVTFWCDTQDELYFVKVESKCGVLELNAGSTLKLIDMLNDEISQ